MSIIFFIFSCHHASFPNVVHRKAKDDALKSYLNKSPKGFEFGLFSSPERRKGMVAQCKVIPEVID